VCDISENRNSQRKSYKTNNAPQQGTHYVNRLFFQSRLTLVASPIWKLDWRLWSTPSWKL